MKQNYINRRSMLSVFLVPIASGLAGCDSHPANLLSSPTYVQVAALYGAPAQFEGKTVRVTYSKVEGYRKMERPDALVPFLVTTDLNRSNGLVEILDDASGKRWLSSNLDEDASYVVSVTGTVKKFQKGQFDGYQLLISDFTVHAQNAVNRAPTTPFTSEPNSKIEIPLPELVKDTNRLSVLHNDYLDKQVRFSIMFTKDDLQSDSSGGILIGDRSVVARLSADLIRPIYDNLHPINHYIVTGKVLRGRDATGRVIVEGQALSEAW